MRIDDSFLHEEDAVFCYRPINAWQWEYRAHSSFYYAYHEEHRAEMVQNQACREPELALVLACVGEMGLFGDCAEVNIWRAVCGEMTEERIRRHRKKMPELVRRISERADAKDILRELYFSVVIPVAVAMDAQEPQIALKLCLCAVEGLEESYG